MPKDDIARVPEPSSDPSGRNGDQAADAAARTDVLTDLRDGSRESIDRLVPLVYQELRAIARQRLASQPRGATLETTALVHEAWLKIADQSQANVRDRAHFLALASLAMRHLLIDRAKSKASPKRAGARWHVTLDEEQVGMDEQPEVLLQLDEALTQLAELEPRLARVVECRFFGGMTEDEIAEVLGTTVRTVQRDWVKARVALRRMLDP